MKPITTKISRKSILYLFFFSLLFACSDDTRDNFPYVYVNVTLDMQNPLYLNLQYVSGSAIVINEGYNRNGILVYRSGLDEFKAYDCTCTYNILDNCAISPSETSIVNAICPCCESEFELGSGSITKGPAITPLKEYRTAFNGTFLNISN